MGSNDKVGLALILLAIVLGVYVSGLLAVLAFLAGLALIVFPRV